MVNLTLLEIIKKKNLNAREIDLINKLIKQGGQFSNKDLASLWGTKTFPKSTKSKLINKPPILRLIQNRPQIYVLISEKEIITAPLKKPQKTVPINKQDNFYQEFQTLKDDYYKFKDNINLQLDNVLYEIQSIKRVINTSVAKEKESNLLLEISDLEREILIIYNQLKIRPHQPIKIEDIWTQLCLKHPYYNWEIFSSQILKIQSNNFHLEEGKVGRYILDSINNKKYGYVIGN